MIIHQSIAYLSLSHQQKRKHNKKKNRIKLFCTQSYYQTNIYNHFKNFSQTKLM